LKHKGFRPKLKKKIPREIEIASSDDFAIEAQRLQVEIEKKIPREIKIASSDDFAIEAQNFQTERSRASTSANSGPLIRAAIRNFCSFAIAP
jgi:hypothetical protein